jgi:hypothetical protein
MAGRPRCANRSCRKAFTPDFRNGTKVANRQRVCPDCGPVIGHRLADQRYRASPTAPRRRQRPASTVPQTHPDTGDGGVEARQDPGTPNHGSVKKLASQVGVHLSAIAALVGGPDDLMAAGGERLARSGSMRNLARRTA